MLPVIRTLLRARRIHPLLPCRRESLRKSFPLAESLLVKCQNESCYQPRGHLSDRHSTYRPPYSCWLVSMRRFSQESQLVPTHVSDNGSPDHAGKAAPEVGAVPKSVGFVGLGNMGAPMAANLLKAGYNLVVHDRNHDAVSALQDKGARSARSPAELADEVDVVITMLPSGPHVLDVYLGASGLLKRSAAIRPRLFIDTSTVDPATCRSLLEAANGCTLAPVSDLEEGGGAKCPPLVVDAPVSGGVPGAQAATLTFMVGGLKPGVDLARRILSSMGTRIVHCGPSGTGSAAKLCNNLALAVQMAGVAEALALGQKLGLEPRLLSQIFNSSTAKSWSSEVYNPVPGVMEGVPASRGYSGGFAAFLMAKDLKLALDASEQQGVKGKTPMASSALSVYSEMCHDDVAKLDFSGIYQHVYNGGPAEPATKILSSVETAAK